MGPGAGLDGCGKCHPHRDSIPGPSMNFAISNNGSEMPPEIYRHARPWFGSRWLHVPLLPLCGLSTCTSDSASLAATDCGTALLLADNTVYGSTVRENGVYGL
jgi:hypothetical protein